MIKQFFIIVSILFSSQVVYALTTDQQENICNKATVIFCENFEDRSTSTVTDLTRTKLKNSGWVLSYPSEMSVQTTEKIEGNKAFRFTYPDNSGGPYIDTNSIGTGITTIYLRWYEKWSSGFKLSSNNTGNAALKVGTGCGGTGCPDVLLFNNKYSDSKWISSLLNAFPLPIDRSQNKNAKTLETDKWYCFENKVVMDSGSYNGVLQGWINGVLVFDYSNISIENITTSKDVKAIRFDASWDCVGGAPGGSNGRTCSTISINDYHALQYKYLDAIVISTVRVGCLGGTEINPPANFRLMKLIDNFIHFLFA